MLLQLKADLNKFADQARAPILARFFQAKEGGYGEGDNFLGLRVPHIRLVAKKYKDLSMQDIQSLLQTDVHEWRLIALFILVKQFDQALKKKDIEKCKSMYDFYLKNTKYINNRDLVDLSTPQIIGKYILYQIEKQASGVPQSDPTKILYKLVKSDNIRERRMAILATFPLLKHRLFDDTLKIAKILLKDSHHLIHKATGWMLREIGKINQEVEEEFLQEHKSELSRTTLRYAIEKFPEDLRQEYLKTKQKNVNSNKQ